MAKNNNYEYINESSIDPALVCVICSTPFDHPRCTPCGHTFCRECIVGWFNSGNSSCPMCRQQPISINSLVCAGRTVRDAVDHLLVKCGWCTEAEFQRCHYDEHVDKECPKVIVPCPSADIKCAWKGSRDQLKNHTATCPFNPFRTILVELMTKNQELQEQIKQQEIKLNHLMGQSPSKYGLF